MTRFARAKGSKASNERIPEPATPWHEMKTELMNIYKEQEASKKKKEVDQTRTKTYENFVREKQEEDAKNVKWADFPGVEKKAKKKLKDKTKIKEVVKNGLVGKKGKKSKVGDIEDDDDDNYDDHEFQSLKRKLEEKLKEQFNKNSDSGDEAPEEVSAKIKPKEPVIKKQKTKKQKLTISVNGNATEEETPEEAAKRKAAKKLERRKQQKLKRREALQGKAVDELTEEEQAKVEKLKQKLLARREKRREFKEKRKAEKAAKAAQQPPKQEKPLEEMTEEERARREKNKQKALARKEKHKQLKEKKKMQETMKINQQSQKQRKPLEEMTEEERAKVEKHRLKKLAQKEKRDRFKQENKQFDEATKKKQKFDKTIKGGSQRKASQLESIKIHGQEVQLARYNGFPVRKEDYDRLVELEKEMRIKGVPRDEIKRAMKLEQRRAEKALARLKKKVCFHCRGSGHNLSECPLLSEQNQHETINSGICFKCGSTEHTHFNCKVVRGDEYKFATCFICKEQGHISRQCPDNSRGLYPQGGACRVCGDVTHLKKDCPRYQAQQEQNTVLAETMVNGNVEGIGEEMRSESPKKKTFKKVIKF